MSLNLIKKQFYDNKQGWINSFNSGLCQDKFGDFLPWMCYPLIEFLQKNLEKNQIIFEFGLGTSTFFFAQRTKKVFALETRKDWFEMMKKIIVKNNYNNIEILLLKNGLENENYEIMPQKILTNNYHEIVDEAFSLNNEKLIFEKFDLILIDSLKREKSTKNSVDAIKKNGKILLDDSERKRYKKIYEFMSQLNYENQEFLGIAPGQIKLKKGTIFFKK